jgi:Transglutaminase-like superfamily
MKIIASKAVAALLRPLRRYDLTGRKTMPIDRRRLLRGGTALAGAVALPNFARAKVRFAPQSGTWRYFEVVTRVDILEPSGATQAWVPVPAVNERDWFKSLGSEWTSNGDASFAHDPKYGAEMLHVEWPDGDSPVVEVPSRIATRDRAIDFAKPGRPAALTRRNTNSTRATPNSFLLTASSNERPIKSSQTPAPTEIEKALAVYEWIVDNTFRDAEGGCGIGDIAAMLRTGNLAGKCADLNALYVGLARAAGLPARDVYGVQIAPSKFGYKSRLRGNYQSTTLPLGALSCRLRLGADGRGRCAQGRARGTANQPGDRRSLGYCRAKDVNWLAHNFAHDVTLPGSSGPRLAFLMYTQTESASARLDCLDPNSFKCVITAKELTSA